MFGLLVVVGWCSLIEFLKVLCEDGALGGGVTSPRRLQENKGCPEDAVVATLVSAVATPLPGPAVPEVVAAKTMEGVAPMIGVIM